MVEKSHTSGFWPSLYEPFRTMGTRLAEFFAPASEASTDGGAYRIAMELPGVEEKDIDVHMDEGVVTVKGEKRTSREEKGETWYFSERQYGSFSRSFRLPPDADETGVKAELKDGVLTVVVPKKGPAETAKAKRIPISRGK
ncbi:Hsp20/alpha crystallin family protein [Ostreiculturibacter nitratireducens]|uniref:Hsp20/alpha crystallin family protein n=1 Tax=Ostreiculturibacter nitratireducens TaxID=3075226 RepID=UPI0031B56AEF